MSWLEHVKKTMKKFPGKTLREVLVEAKKTYKKGEEVVKYAVTGKKARKHHKKSAKKSHKKSHKKSAKKSHKVAKKSAKKSRSSRRR